MRKIDLNLPNIPPLKDRRKELRNHPTPAEAVLWRSLRRKQILGKKFRRQFSVGCYVMDFYCAECNLGIELDGAPHYQILREDYEAKRTAFLENQGIELIRFENRIVFQNIEAVLETIREAVTRRSEV